VAGRRRCHGGSSGARIWWQQQQGTFRDLPKKAYRLWHTAAKQQQQQGTFGMLNEGMLNSEWGGAADLEQQQLGTFILSISKANRYRLIANSCQSSRCGAAAGYLSCFTQKSLSPMGYSSEAATAAGYLWNAE
jgi:hypothetical protein